MSDVVYAAKRVEPLYSDFDNNGKVEQGIEIGTDFMSKYYLALSVKDAPGVLSSVAGIFARHNVSIENVIQRGGPGGAALSLLTHSSCESDVRKAVAEIEESDDSNKVESLIRVL